jgi:3-oxoacyl-ACP reductase-like protein
MDYKVKRSFYLGETWHVTGEVISGLPDETAVRLIEMGLAEEVSESKPMDEDKPADPGFNNDDSAIPPPPQKPGKRVTKRNN